MIKVCPFLSNAEYHKDCIEEKCEFWGKPNSMCDKEICILTYRGR